MIGRYFDFLGTVIFFTTMAAIVVLCGIVVPAVMVALLFNVGGDVPVPKRVFAGLMLVGLAHLVAYLVYEVRKDADRTKEGDRG